MQPFFESTFISELDEFYDFFDYEKVTKKNRKNLNNVRPGVSKNISKNSIKRDKNNSLIQQFINLNQKKGNKLKMHKYVNKMIENLFSSLSFELEEFKNYNLYSNTVFLHNNDPEYSDINKLIEYFAIEFKSIFEIKTIKNSKRLKSPNKYTHEIAYIPRNRRLKYVLRSLTLYKNSFNNYNLWERIFWSFFKTIVNKNNSFLKRRKEYIYIKSMKFFKKKKK